MMPSEVYDKQIAYFTMEIALDNRMNTYSGGLGVLAGDTMRSFADLQIPTVGVTQINSEGYCDQKIDEGGKQIDSAESWNPSEFLEPLSSEISLKIGGEEVKVGGWKKTVEGENGYEIPMIFLDTNIEENSEKFKKITKRLYGGDQEYRLMQEVVLGIGGVRFLNELNYEVDIYHINESHSSLLALELLKNSDMDLEYVRDRCVFTTHTPEGSGHDKFSYDLVERVLGDYISIETLKEISREDNLHMTELALNLSGYINAVSKRHGEVSESMFPGYEIDAITNGVHIPRWVSDSFRAVYDEYLPGWRKDPFKLKHAIRIPDDEIWEAHLKEKDRLIDYVNDNAEVEMNDRVFTIGFARRAAPYKRADLIFHNPDRLVQIAKEVGDFQVLFAGKAHPQADMSKKIIKSVYNKTKDLKEDIKMAYLENYDLRLGALLTFGVDLWLNNPERGREACGTSGMKAACNGIPQLGTLDGWWIEGHIKDVTGWKIGLEPEEKADNADEVDSNDLYEKLEEKVIPRFYTNKKGWIKTMKSCISFNASYFNTHRMVREYFLNAYM
ncbi:MAG: alpha-glucan family phosphorylase [Candidatus Hadarchaeia archaeon]